MNALYGQVLRVAFRRPSLVPALLGSAWAFRSRDWFARPPFLPVPSERYLRWRIETAYGDGDTLPPAEELERFLRWASEMRKGR